MQQQFIIETLHKLGKQGNFLNLIKEYRQKTTSIVLNDEKLRAFPPRLIARYGCKFYGSIINNC